MVKMARNGAPKHALVLQVDNRTCRLMELKMVFEESKNNPLHAFKFFDRKNFSRSLHWLSFVINAI